MYFSEKDRITCKNVWQTTHNKTPTCTFKKQKTQRNGTIQNTCRMPSSQAMLDWFEQKDVQVKRKGVVQASYLKFHDYMSPSCAIIECIVAQHDSMMIHNYKG